MDAELCVLVLERRIRVYLYFSSSYRETELESIILLSGRPNSPSVIAR